MAGSGSTIDKKYWEAESPSAHESRVALTPLFYEIAAGEFRSLNSVILQFLDEQLKMKNVYWRKGGQKNPESEL